METAVATTGTEGQKWGGGDAKPLNASYGKMMMWFFILSDALTFSGFLAAYGFSRFKFIEEWPIADEVFNHFPFLHGVDAPMFYVALMTFILIGSSVTMVLAVDAGHHMDKKKVSLYMLLTIIGGFIFVGSQAWEWANFINGEYGAVQTNGGKILQFVKVDDHKKRVGLDEFVTVGPRDAEFLGNSEGIWYESSGYQGTYTIEEVKNAFKANPDITIRTQQLIENPETGASEKLVLSREEALIKLEKDGKAVVEGANLTVNEYGAPLFADFFFFITGFHGFHVFSGVMINLVIFFNVLLGTYERRKSYEMVEKVGLYWHFVDLVWVFVFTFFYLV
ncbi:MULTISPECIES: cytochrome c oxidase subunit 3 [Nonlabens]|uniref:cytochrome c oxidase subunit 3 n=1 Tax=Nonlabens TaxID=363408 RepID=UPI000A206E6B|nr:MULTISPECIES: cytochrome c oxidase subunit 3 [Nonlabens]ARN72066.1 cytochrome oxidase subunit III [Nonlabens tegetincola]MEE2802042.1 cytochrome c oxidase subunit 3 [Bacteroidota bacterium]PQJ20317.1 cytochrome oxidase subunit III [Nonlabens tegetincola]